jgi:hypothetical protein
MSMSRASLVSHRSPSAIVLAAFLTKLAKHLALLVCLAIVSAATGRAALGQRSILLLAVCAALIHALGQTLKRRSHNRQTTLRGST